MPSFRVHLELHVAVLALGLTAIFGKLLEMGVVQATAGRSTIAAVVLGLVIYWRGQRLTLSSYRAHFWTVLAGLLLAAHWATFLVAVRTGSVAAGMLGVFTFPVMVTFFEPIVFGERLRKWSIVHGVAVLGGIALVVPELSLANPETAGLAWGLLSAVLYTVRNLMNRRFVRTDGPMPVMFWQVLTAGVALSPAFFLLSSSTQLPMDLLWLLLLGVVCTAAGHTMLIASFRHFRVATASIILTLEPVYAVLLAIPIFHEWPPWQTWLGGMIILAAIGHESYRYSRSPRSTPGDATAEVTSGTPTGVR